MPNPPTSLYTTPFMVFSVTHTIGEQSKEDAVLMPSVI